MLSKNERIRSTIFCVLAAVAIGASAMLMGGCAEQDRPDPTTRALDDPMNYSPHFDNPDISGGGTADFHSQSFRRDMDHVLNP
ncbi:MAG: hypothetical protein M3O30_08995 [Planctomycetota bacterium]|nr:hypothetical protein [Planctomycetota bacterium]